MNVEKFSFLLRVKKNTEILQILTFILDLRQTEHVRVVWKGGGVLTNLGQKERQTECVSAQVTGCVKKQSRAECILIAARCRCYSRLVIHHFMLLFHIVEGELWISASDSLYRPRDVCWGHKSFHWNRFLSINILLHPFSLGLFSLSFFFMFFDFLSYVHTRARGHARTHTISFQTEEVTLERM